MLRVAVRLHFVGWQKFDPNAPPCTVDEIRKEREFS
jgi:hypothetical protein